MTIGEAGSLLATSPTENQPITVTLTEPLTNPVFALTGTANGGDPYILRVIGQTLDGNGDTTAFTFIIEEFEYLDGPHTATETVNWLAIEEGVHTLPDGRLIEASTNLISSTAHNTGGSATFSAPFPDPPVVLTSVMSNNDTTTVDSDPSNITSSGFDLTLQEEEAEDGVHAAETIGWIAIQAGGDATSGTANAIGGVNSSVDVLGLGATFTDSVVVSDTQTINGGDTARVAIDSQTNNSVGVFLQEEQSADEETFHTNETVGIVAFEEGLIPCFTKGTRIQTPLGLVNVELLNVGDWVDTVDNGPQQIRWIGRRCLKKHELLAHPDLRPVRILAHALGKQLPERDLLVSKQHRMLVSSKIAERMFGQREVLISSIKLTALPGIFVDEQIETVEYHHLLFDGHQLVLAEGAKTESLYLGVETQMALSPEARQEVDLLFPELAEGFAPDTARHVPLGRLQKKLMKRHLKNQRRALI